MMQGTSCEQTIALGGFLNLLEYLRTVILQDAAIFKDPLFQSAERHTFRAESTALVQNAEDPAEPQLQRALPLLTDRLTANESATHQLLSQNSSNY